MTAVTDKRLILIGGKGGVGKTTVSSSLSLLAASRGKRVLVVSTDPAHSLADAFDCKIGDRLTHICDGVDALEIDPDKAVKEHIEQVTAQMKRFTRPDMFTEIERQMRLTQQSPGAQEAALLERICRLIEEAEQDYDLLIFDTAPTGHTLRLLSLPEAMAAWTQGMLKQQGRSEKLAGVLDHLTPKAGKDIANPIADPKQAETDGMDDRTRQITERLLERQRLFQRSRRRFQDTNDTALMFVLTPEKLPILETQRAVAALAEEKLPLHGLVINRVLPATADGDFLAQRRQQELQYLQDIEQSFSALQRYQVPLMATDIQGLDALRQIANHLQQAGL
ncbi:ArsA family ATPase [Idiomarina xiamenensis]|uniref:arsenite-transporting ATPase n=1 Tax=Idiomarina xiamenensis 10-D-4 TaxID=740709 RepID=K2KA99_9GAMM|nr:ArsA family ATPase [Idiomarina xiamenensis]EKE84713.1 arsenical pump-driving ATPase [Idiomarina xiamenensis 10-D-4]